MLFTIKYMANLGKETNLWLLTSTHSFIFLMQTKNFNMLNIENFWKNLLEYILKIACGFYKFFCTLCVKYKF